jgi:monovalent cation:H+ antiporter-2, CPA2 family
VIAGLAVAAGREPALGPLATAYVLILAVLGPILARASEPLARLVRRRTPPSATSAGSLPAPQQTQDLPAP